jgi:PPOX class probable F420-dependent enzyme
MPDPGPAATELVAIPAHLRAFLEAPRFVTLATVDPDGAPRAVVVWCRLEPDGTVMVNSADGRLWPANLRHEPRVALSFIDPADGYRWVGMSAVVERIDDDQPTAQADIAALARSYHADEPEEAERLIASRFERQQRVSFRLRPLAIHDHLE